MNTTTFASRTFVAVACVAAVATGAVACGTTQDTTSPPAAAAVAPAPHSGPTPHGTAPRATTTEDFVNQQKANWSARWRRTAAARAHSTPQHEQDQRAAQRYPDPRREAINEERNYAHIPASVAPAH